MARRRAVVTIQPAGLGGRPDAFEGAGGDGCVGHQCWKGRTSMASGATAVASLRAQRSAAPRSGTSMT
jgi:hypothetical protein